MPDSLQCAASFDWEALLPVLFFLLYGLAQLFGGKKKKGEQAPEDEDALERARQIREEIRRKIEARKQAVGGSETDRPEYDPTLPDGQQRRPQPQRQPTMVQPRTRPVEQSARRVPAPATVHQRERTPETGREKSLEEMLEEQRRQVEKSRQRMKEARARAREIQKSGPNQEMRKDVGRKSPAASPVARSGSKNMRNQLLSGLHHPESIRQAVLFREILGKPLGLR